MTTRNGLTAAPKAATTRRAPPAPKNIVVLMESKSYNRGTVVTEVQDRFATEAAALEYIKSNACDDEAVAYLIATVTHRVKVTRTIEAVAIVETK